MSYINKIARVFLHHLANCSKQEFDVIHNWLLALAHALPAIRAKEREEDMSKYDTLALEHWNRNSNNVQLDMKSVPFEANFKVDGCFNEGVKRSYTIDNQTGDFTVAYRKTTPDKK